MTHQTTQDQKLEGKLLELRTKVIAPCAQAKLREEVLSKIELDALQRKLPDICDDDIPVDCEDPEELKFRRAFDFNGRNNMVALAEFREVSQMRIVLDMAVELGFLMEASYRRYARQLEPDSTIRPSVFLQYSDGKLYRNAVLIGTVQERSCPTNMQTVLQMFQDQNWPTTVPSPSGWDEEKVTNACRRLRDRFEGHVSFHVRDGGESIHLNISNDNEEAAPN